MYRSQNIQLLHCISNKSLYEIDEVEEPVEFLYYYPTYNFNPENIVQTCKINKEKYMEITGFGVYTFFSRRILR